MIDPQVTMAVRRAAVRATLAPSMHNTQPWRFVASRDTLEIHTDPSRQLHVLDPRGRQVVLSCGCALFNARAAIAACGLRSSVRRFPMGSHSTLVAVIEVAGGSGIDQELATLDSVVEVCQAIRPSWRDKAVPPQLVDVLVDAASREGAQLQAISRWETREAIARLPRPTARVRHRERIYGTGPQAWMSEELLHRRPDPPSIAASPKSTTVECDAPTDPNDTAGSNEPPVQMSVDGCLLLLNTGQDDPACWLRAGESLQRVTLEMARNGYAASALAQVIEMTQTNALLRQELKMQAYPQALLLVGPAVSTPQLRRRRLVDMLTHIG